MKSLGYEDWVAGGVDIGEYGIAAVARIKELEVEVEHLNQFCIDSLSEKTVWLGKALATARNNALQEAAMIADAATYHLPHCDQYCGESCPTNVDVEAAILALKENQ
jgi:hypothetical protein